MKITDSKYVTLTYDLNVGEGDERELMEQATPKGHSNLSSGQIQC